MRRKTLLFSSFVFAQVIAVASLANTIRFGETATHYWQKVPYQQCWGADGGGKPQLEKIMKVSWDKFLKRLENLDSSSIFSYDMTEEDIALARVEAAKTRNNVAIANEMTDVLLAERGNEVDVSELYPDAFLVFGGVKASASLGLKGGVGGMMGMIVMPYCYREIDKETGEESDRTWDIDVDFVGWSGPSFGVGVGGGVRWRVGAGAVWSYDHDFDEPSKFNGVYGGASCNAALGVGVSVKAGVVKKLNTLNFPDFGVVTVAWDSGVVAEAACNLNAYAIIPGSEILELFGNSLRSLVEQEKADLEQAIRDGIREGLQSQNHQQ